MKTLRGRGADPRGARRTEPCGLARLFTDGSFYPFSGEIYSFPTGGQIDYVFAWSALESVHKRCIANEENEGWKGQLHLVGRCVVAI